MTKKFFLIAIIIILAGAIFGGIFGHLPIQQTSADTVVTAEKVVADYSEAIDVINNNYVSDLNHEKITESSIQGMLFTLDPHSSFFTKEEFRKLYEEQSSQFYGIGVSILQHRDGVYIESVVPGTPADKAGLRYGDKFIEIEGKDSQKWTSSEVSKNVRGERGSSVNIKVARAGSDKPVEYTIVRGGVPLPSIRNFFMLSGGVGYVGLTGGFQETTGAELEEAIAKLKSQGMKSLVLDLRNNPGGLLQEAIKVVSKFVSKGQTVVSVKGRSRYSKSEELLTNDANTEDFPLVVLINGGSASASEIVSGAIQDYGRGLIVGTDSFGKGLVQRVFNLPYDTGLTLTMARYYTPYGRSLQRDYSNGSIYEYYSHSDGSETTTDAKPKPVGSPVTTAGGRVFYGGQGITPDVKSPAIAFSPLRGRIAEAAFYFARQLVAGQIKGFENYRADKQSFNLVVQPNEFAVSDKLFEAFRAYTASDKLSGLTADNFSKEIDFAKSRLRGELATANYSSEAGQQVLLENDPQVLKAVESIPDSKQLFATIAAKK
jgi:carboxyl-terminal processing protease